MLHAIAQTIRAPPPRPAVTDLVGASKEAGARRWLSISTKTTKIVKGSRHRALCTAALVFPNRIAELRGAMTPSVAQRELSAALGLSGRQLRRIERGEVAPNAQCMARIAKALRVGVADLYLRQRDGRT